jgi:ArsR family transcriptional regulator
MHQPNKSETSYCAQICQALADPIRILLVYQLAEGPKSVNELSALLNQHQPTISRHLKVLRERGITQTERFGTTVMYSLADHRVIDALNLLRTLMTDNLLQKTALVDFLNQTS